jgi:hypothetical protein
MGKMRVGLATGEAMPNTAQGLLDLLEQAREADLSSRIELRDPIAAHGVLAIKEIRSWLGDPAMVSFAIRVIEKAATADAAARTLAIETLRAVRGNTFAEPVRRDVEEALTRLGAGGRSSLPPRAAATRMVTEPIPALVRGQVYRRRDLREAGLLGNLYSGISYPAKGDHACLFSGGPNSESYGYRDMPSGENGYRYFGEWRGTRDMSLTGGNLMIVNRSPNLYYFVNEGNGLHRFEGRFMVTGHERVVAEREGTIGEAIVFMLERVADEVRL